MIKRQCVYDIEIYKNLFLVVFKDISDGRLYVFEISKRKDERVELIEFLKTCSVLIGFNNVEFDYPLLHTFVRTCINKPKLKGKQLVELLFNKAQDLIHTSGGARFKRRKIIPMMRQVDLFLINHYDNFAKSTSLKVLEFNLEMPRLQNLPYAFNKILTDQEIYDVVMYCDNDVDTTYQFFLANKKSIDFRSRMSRLYRHDFTNYNDVKIGEEILLNEVSRAMELDKFDVRKMRTKRKVMLMSEIILPYIEFESTEFNTLLTWWKDKIITKTKGQFTELPLDEVEPLLPYCNNKTTKGKLKNLNIVFNNFQFDFGTGGLHGACHPGIFKEDDDHEIILIDVSSYYPNLASSNGFHPKHIPQDVFIQTVNKLYRQRMDAKERGDDEMVSAIKLALNGALYGKSNSPYSFMYDPQFMMSICVNGQLLLAMLSEKCVLAGMQLIQVNTDGVMVRLKRSDRHKLDAIVKEWEALTRLSLGYDHFKLVAQRDVNNYLAQYVDGSVKNKGAFDYNYTENGDFHKDYSMLVVPKALEQYFMNGIEPEQFMYSHDILYDYFKRTKYGRDTELLERTHVLVDDIVVQQDVKIQNTTRYYVSMNGKRLIKRMRPLAGQTEYREFAVEAGHLCTVVNNMTPEAMELMSNDLNYMYYVDKVRQIIRQIEV